MAKIQLYFQDLTDENKEEIIKQLKEELRENIQDQIKDNPEMKPDDVEREYIDSYINEHNFANEFKI